MPRGLSVHAFKTAFVPSQPLVQPPAPKYDPRPPASNGGAPWNRQLSYQASRSEAERKQPPLVLSQDRRVIPVPQPGSQPWPVDTKYAKSQKGYSIHPSLEGDGVFVYERSILSVDDLSSSPSSDSSSDSELYPEVELAMSRLEISSTRASSSTETLESTLYPNLQSRGPINGNAAAPGLSRPPLAITAPPPRPPSTRPPTDSSPGVRPAPVPVTRSDSHRPRTTSISHAVHPIQFSSADAASDSDSDTLFSEGNPDAMVVDMLGASQAWSTPMGIPQYARSSAPSRRDADQRVLSSRPRRDSLDTSTARSRAPAVPAQYREEGPGRADDAAHPRAPPGLYGVVATPPDAPHYGSPPRGSATAPSAVSSSPPGPSAASTPPGTASASRSQQQQQQQMSGMPQQLARTASIRPSIPAQEAPTRPSETSVGGPSTPTAPPSRKNSQAGAPQGSPPQAVGNGIVVPSAKRSVRWNENLVCPSPVPPENRRKGWFNRRGDQLWTNDGQYRLPEQGQEFPPDLALYPEPNTGWMNEEGTRIDMQHRLIPKRPLRSALKQPKSAQSV
ncbi:hypothetical protein C8Q78DRAFT_1076269 [Trametes maxima]|nr:hypothetical protein C8Q78DRAFT_1076269 [Trametes maxima]